MAGRNDPRLLYSIPNIRAYHIEKGVESSLTPSGSQTLSLLMVPTSSPFADMPNADSRNEVPEEDFYLHLNLPPELDLPLPATTQIYHQPPNSYLIPRWDLGPDSGAFTRIEFPGVGREPGLVSQEDVDTFETILAQCTAFLERAAPPAVAGYGKEKGGKGFYSPPQYNPADYAPGEGYAPYGGGGSGSADPATTHPHGHIVLIDEENGSVVGELSEGFHVVEDSNLKAGSKSTQA
jgi:spartin